MKHYFIMLGLCSVFATTGLAQNNNGVTLPQKPHRATYTDYRQNEKGFWCAAEWEGGSSVMVEHRNMQSVQLAYTAGYRFNEFIKVGAGLGGRYYVNNNKECRGEASAWTLPIFVNARGNFISQTDRSVVPYWSVCVGGIVGDGAFLSPSVGLRIGEPRNSWLLGISYCLNHINTSQLVSTDKKVSTSHALQLHIGYEF